MRQPSALFHIRNSGVDIRGKEALSGLLPVFSKSTGKFGLRKNKAIIVLLELKFEPNFSTKFKV